MIRNLIEYFKPEYTFFLHEIQYNIVEGELKGNNLQIECGDIIKSKRQGDIVQVIFERKIEFDPEVLFSMTVAFGAELILKEERVDEIEWDKVDLSQEFRENGDFVISGLASRVSLMIAQITSAAGFAPLILPPSQGKEYKN